MKNPQNTFFLKGFKFRKRKELNYLRYYMQCPRGITTPLRLKIKTKILFIQGQIYKTKIKKHSEILDVFNLLFAIYVHNCRCHRLVLRFFKKVIQVAKFVQISFSNHLLYNCMRKFIPYFYLYF